MVNGMRFSVHGLSVLMLGAFLGCSDDVGSSNGGAGGGGAGGAGGGATGGAGGSPVGGGGAGASDALPSAGCEQMALYPSGMTTEAELSFGGLTRTFRVHVPASAEVEAMPLVLMFHGGGGSGKQFEETSSKMNLVADAEGFIAVYPDGTGPLRTWNAGGCCGSAVTNEVDDVGFVNALLDQLESSLCVDRRRVFAAGMSNGGMLTHRLACELPQRFAAFVPVASGDLLPECTPSEPVPLMHIHGTEDGHVPVEGGLGCGPSGVAFPPLAQTMERRRTANGCDATTSESFVAGDGSCEAYQGCEADVLLCLVEGGGHNWPGGEPPGGLIDCPADGGQSTTFIASEQAWNFFKSHPKP